jgi:TPR repeat protein
MKKLLFVSLAAIAAVVLIVTTLRHHAPVTLIEAAKNGTLYTVPSQLLTEENLTFEDKDGATPLHWAANNGHLDQIPKELLTRKNLTRKNAFGNTPLHYAAAQGHLDQVPRELLTRENLTLKNNNGATALDAAVSGNHLDQIPQENLAPAEQKEISLASKGSAAPAPDAKPAESDGLAAMRAKAESGDVSAQFALGEIYASGTLVARDWTEAAQWYHRAAEQGHANAQFALAEMYAVGEITVNNSSELDNLLRKSVEQKAVPDIEYLSLVHETSYGVAEDRREAVKWYRRAAEQGHADAQYALAEMYHWGKEGVAKDETDAEELYRKAAAQGHARAKAHLAAQDIGRELDAVAEVLKKINDTHRKTNEDTDRFIKAIDEANETQQPKKP